MCNNGICFPNYKSIMRVQTEVQNCDSSLISIYNTKEIYYKSQFKKIFLCVCLDQDCNCINHGQ